MRKKEGSAMEKKNRRFLPGICMLLLGIVIGIFLSPVKRGMIVGSYNGNGAKLPEDQEEGNAKSGC